MQVRFHIAKNGRDYFNEWLETLDRKVRSRVLEKILRLQDGFGKNVKSLANKLWELKVDYGPGYRVYFTKEGDEVVIVVAGSDKGKQERTIALAKRLVEEVEVLRNTDKNHGIPNT